MKNKKNLFILTLILIIAFILRIVNLETVPKALHADEVSFLLNAISLKQTLKDEDGRLLPLFLESLTDPKPALYSYLQIPFILIFGVSTFSSRMPAVILGVLSIFLAYKIFKILGEKKYALVLAFLLSISPWHIILSRSTQEVIMSLAFSLLSIFLFLRIINFKKINLKLNLIFFFMASLLAMYSYHSAKIFLPSLIFVWSIFYYWQNKNQEILQKTVLLCGSILTVFLALLVFTGEGARFQAVGFLSNIEPQLILEEQIREATAYTPLLILRILFNKATFYGLSILQTYLQHFSIKFLFFEGGFPLRYKIPLHGLFYHISIFSILMGFYLFLKNKKFTKQHFSLLSWLFLSPLAAAITFIESPSTIRTAMMLFPLTYFASISITYIWELKSKLIKSLALLILALGYSWGFLYFIHQFFIMQAIFEPHYRNRPYELVSENLKNYIDNYDSIVITNDLRPLYAYLALDGLISIEELQNHSLERLTQNSYQLGKFKINKGVCDLTPYEYGVLYIAENRCFYPGGHNLKASIAYDDGLGVYSIFEKKKPE